MLLTHIDKWGPNFWQTLHTITFTYPNYPSKKHQRVYRQVLQLLGMTLPCQICRVDFLRYMRQHPPNMTSKYTLSKYMVDAHNVVNEKLNKPILSYDIVQSMYLSPNSVPKITSNISNQVYTFVQPILYVVIVAIIVLMIFCIVKCMT